jgi:hypothetical protein
MNYNVGQVLYLLSAKTMKVFPVQVVEEITKKTLGGEEINYTVMLPDKEKTQINLKELDVVTFTDLSSCKSFMLENAESSINQVLESAKKIKKVFKSIDNEISIKEQIDESVQNNESDSIISVDIGGGLKARVNVSELEKLKQ